MGFDEVMRLPVRAFWLLSNSVHRIQADSDLRSLSIAAGAQSGEGFENLREALTKEVGEITKQSGRISAARDEEGFELLKNMAG
jgi:hypothetical protein